MFTGVVGALKISLPLIDEYKYYALNFNILLNGKNQTTNPEIVVYDGQNLTDTFSSTKIISVVESKPTWV
jgi:hypothetical protein